MAPKKAPAKRAPSGRKRKAARKENTVSETSRDSASVASESSADSKTSMDVDNLGKADLQALCRRLGLPTGGTVTELRKRIKEPRDKEQDKPRDEEEEEWREVMLTRTRINLKKIPAPSWADPKSLLSPGLWAYMLWSNPLSDNDVFGRMQLVGESLRGIADLWEAKWNLGKDEKRKMETAFQDLYMVVTNRPKNMTPMAWAARYWDRFVAPVSAQALLAQADLVPGTAREKLKRLAKTPWGSLSWEAGDVVHGKASSGTKHDDASSDGESMNHVKDRGAESSKIRCRNCRKHYKLAKNQSSASFFAEHNKTCTKKK